MYLLKKRMYVLIITYIIYEYTFFLKKNKKAAKSENILENVSIFLNILLSLFILIYILLKGGLLYNYIKSVI